MAAVYLMGYRDGIGKKSGKWYGMVNLLTKDGYGNWAIMQVFCENREAFEQAVDCGLYEPIIVSINLPGHLIGCINDESHDSLNLAE